MNNELRENQINRDYYLKRAIIYSLIAIGGIYVAHIVGLGASMTQDKVGDALFSFAFGACLLLFVFLIFVFLAIYYTTKF